QVWVPYWRLFELKKMRRKGKLQISLSVVEIEKPRFHNILLHMLSQPQYCGSIDRSYKLISQLKE
ncbi:hypothetical protein Lal_00000512, partial [Lupinus albus]